MRAWTAGNGAARSGVPALGIDVNPAAVLRGRVAGGVLLHRSVFDRVPGQGRWSTALLVDGSVGIGGAPAALFTRVRELLVPGGLLLVEVEPADEEEVLVGWVEDSFGRRTGVLRWARLGTAPALRVAADTGYEPVESWERGGRSFLALRSRLTAKPTVAAATIASTSTRLRR